MILQKVTLMHVYTNGFYLSNIMLIDLPVVVHYSGWLGNAKVIARILFGKY